eukprot:gnl/TRDRNA2_/TRDRNA2_61890_c0_seq1.p1 gnl/TRDRNA2_/TRDRNA2_61890_c0~~gnl/TRDRNA2_/TRDRNA2_61890_c0_seq1.p1  ORF type:complete len:482 (-),score=58.33 gnl/TRDRNA2_/TRDRNA2_61890_c0_seq1:63-1472(-)
MSAFLSRLCSSCCSFGRSNYPPQSNACSCSEGDGVVQDVGSTEASYWSWSSQLEMEDLLEPESVSKQERKMVSVMAMSGATVATLPVQPRGDLIATVKQRVRELDGTPLHMQKIVCNGEVLRDSHLVFGGEPLVLVRIQRKRAIIASVHADFRTYDIETGEAMRSANSESLRLTCIATDWEQARCFSGSADGTVRVWDIERGECTRTLLGNQSSVCALCTDLSSKILAAAEDGTLKIWSLDDASHVTPLAVATGARGKMMVSVDWSHFVAVVVGEWLYDGAPRWGFRAAVAGYDLSSGGSLWSVQLASGPSPVLELDWQRQRYVIAPGGGQLELRHLGAGSTAQPLSVQRFGPPRCHKRGLVRTDWEESRLLALVEPFALEMWSLLTLERLLCLRDPLGDGTEIVSLDVDWSCAVPRAITCRTYVDWVNVVGEVCIQHWDLEENGACRKVSADHPLVGGFDIVAVSAQF